MDKDQQQLIEDHMKLAYRLAHDTSSPFQQVNKDDLLDVAQEALVKAVLKFVPSRGYAYPCIYNALMSYLSLSSREMVIEDIDDQNQHRRDINLLIKRYLSEDKNKPQKEFAK